MTREELLALYKQYAHDNMVLSYHNKDDESYRKLVEAGPDILPLVAERLKDSIGHDSGKDFDYDNSPWLSIMLMDELTNGECAKDMPEVYAGCLNEIRSHYLQWANDQDLVSFSSNELKENAE